MEPLYKGHIGTLETLRLSLIQRKIILTFPVVVNSGAFTLRDAKPLSTSWTLNPELLSTEAAIVDRNPPRQKAMYLSSL